MLVNIGKGIELAVDTDKLPENVKAHVMYIGLRNILMDAHAGVTREEAGESFVDQSRSVSEKKLESMYNGEVRTVGTRTGDPVRGEAIRIAAGLIKAQYRKLGKKVSDIDAKALREAAVKLVDKTPAILEQAQKNVEAANAIDGVDLTGLVA